MPCGGGGGGSSAKISSKTNAATTITIGLIGMIAPAPIRLVEEVR